MRVVPIPDPGLDLSIDQDRFECSGLNPKDPYLLGDQMTEEYQKVFKGVHGCYNDYPKNENDNILAGLSYLTWIVALVALIAIKPLSPYLRFHACQAIGLAIVGFGLGVIMGATIMFFIGLCLLPFSMALGIYMLVIMIIVLTGKDHRVPLLADYVEEKFV
jgi:uncharacterized membrane protein